MVVGLLALACDGDPPTLVPLDQAEAAFEQSYCERMFECECDDSRRFDTIDDCRTWVSQEVAELENEANGSDLEYDPSCFGAIVDRLDANGCAPAVESDDECVAPCFPLHGDVPLQGACTRSSDYSDCAQGLECSQTGVCVDPCYDACNGYCGDDEQCIDGMCMPLPDTKSLGEACSGHSECATGYCPAGFCDELPGEGESCEGTLACAAGLACDTNVCVPGDAIVCQLSIEID